MLGKRPKVKVSAQEQQHRIQSILLLFKQYSYIIFQVQKRYLRVEKTSSLLVLPSINAICNDRFFISENVMFACSSKHKGFTLLELMIVLAIIAIMAALAIPNYQTYIKKAKFSEVIGNVMPYRTAIEVCSQLLGGLNRASKNCWTPGKNDIPADYSATSNDKGYVHTIQVSSQGGTVLITATSQNLDKDYTYALRAEYTEDSGLTWSVDPSSTCLTAGLCRE